MVDDRCGIENYQIVDYSFCSNDCAGHDNGADPDPRRG
jgi:hypothetical protein